MPELDDPLKHCCTARHGVEVYLVDVVPAVVEVLDDLAMWVDDPVGHRAAPNSMAWSARASVWSAWAKLRSAAIITRLALAKNTSACAGGDPVGKGGPWRAGA